MTRASGSIAPSIEKGGTLPTIESPETNATVRLKGFDFWNLNKCSGSGSLAGVPPMSRCGLERVRVVRR